MLVMYICRGNINSYCAFSTTKAESELWIYLRRYKLYLFWGEMGVVYHQLGFNLLEEEEEEGDIHMPR